MEFSELHERAFDMVDKLDLPISLCSAGDAAPRDEKLLATNATMNAFAHQMAIILLAAGNVPLGERTDPKAPLNFVTGRILEAAKAAAKSCLPKRAN